jgi:hypothetical protein
MAMHIYTKFQVISTLDDKVLLRQTRRIGDHIIRPIFDWHIKNDIKMKLDKMLPTY